MRVMGRTAPGCEHRGGSKAPWDYLPRQVMGHRGHGDLAVEGAPPPPRSVAAALPRRAYLVNREWEEKEDTDFGEKVNFSDNCSSAGLRCRALPKERRGRRVRQTRVGLANSLGGARARPLGGWEAERGE